jgi:hypothetical protein
MEGKYKQIRSHTIRSVLRAQRRSEEKNHFQILRSALPPHLTLYILQDVVARFADDGWNVAIFVTQGWIRYVDFYRCAFLKPTIEVISRW